MSYTPADPKIVWDRPGPLQGVTLEREIDGEVYAERIPHNGLVSQALAARLLGVSLMTINKWVRAGKVHHIKVTGQPSAIPLAEVKKFRKLITEARRDWRGAWKGFE